MAIHYDPKTKRFRDDKGRLVARDRAMRSSIARKEYEKAQAKAKRKPKPAPPPPPPKRKPKPAPPPPPKPKPKRKPKPAPPPPPKVSPAKPKAKRKPKDEGPRIPPWEREGIVKEYPDPDEWFPEIDFYGYDDLLDDWGDFDDEDTDS